MSSGLYSITTRASGTILTAAIYNADHQNHVTNQNPEMTGAYSDNVAQMQTQTNPGGVGSESLASALSGELERLRYVLAQIMGTTYWYDYANSTVGRGNVTGPVSSTDLHIALFSGATGKLLADSGYTLPSLLRQGFLTGLTLSNDGVTPNTKLDIAGGNCIDDTNVAILAGSAGTIDFTTNGANGLDTGAIAASTWYHIFIIGKAGGASPAYLASTSLSSPTFPTGYTLKRRLGSVKTNPSSQIIGFTQNSDEFWWGTPGVDIAASAPGSAAVTRTLASVPTGVVVTAILNVVVAGPNPASPEGVYMSALASADIAASINNCSPVIDANLAAQKSGAQVRVMTNTSAQIRTRNLSGASGSSLNASTLGWIDTRGRFN